MKQQKVTAYIAVVLIVLTTGFIFVNSALPEEKSNSVSKTTAQAVEAMVTDDGAKEAKPISIFLIKYIRKAAHAVEFFALGLFICLFQAAGSRFDRASVVQIGALLLETATIDESIQILSVRGSNVRDILLDFVGGAVAVFLFLILYFSVTRLQKTVRKKKEG